MTIKMTLSSGAFKTGIVVTDETLKTDEQLIRSACEQAIREFRIYKLECAAAKACPPIWILKK